MKDGMSAQQFLTLDKFSQRLRSLTTGWDWEVEGFVDKKGYVYPIDTDTKVISTAFERLVSPVVRTIAKEFGYNVETANQTTYPDFTLTRHGRDKNPHRIALDVKTTYRSSNMVLTLGGYNSFLRNNTKNILYPYDSYAEHWIVGFLYEQRASFREYDLESMPRHGEIPCPYQNVFLFIRDKHSLTGLRAGSGNTKNIGSFRAQSPADFEEKSGPFSIFRRPKEACDHYWRNYERYSDVISTASSLEIHEDFTEFEPEPK